MGYLDAAGLAHLWGRVKAALSRKQDALTPDGSITLQGGAISVATPVKGVTQAEYGALNEEQRQADVLYVVDEPAWVPAPVSIQEYDTEDGWHIRKWSDGYVELIAEKSKDATSWSNISTGVRYCSFDSDELPFPLIKEYEINATAFDKTEQGAAVLPLQRASGLNPLDETGPFWLISFTSPPPSSVGVVIRITGRWK